MKMRTRRYALSDLILAPNLPEFGFLSVFRLAGSYAWDPVDMGAVDRFGRALPVELLAEGIDRRSPVVERCPALDAAAADAPVLDRQRGRRRGTAGGGGGGKGRVSGR